MELNRIYNEDLFVTMNRMIDDDQKVDIVLTSPPYNTGRNIGENGDKEARMKNNEVRYDIYLEKRNLI